MRFTPEQREALIYLISDMADLFELDYGDDEETDRRRAIVRAMIAESDSDPRKNAEMPTPSHQDFGDADELFRALYGGDQ